MAYEKQTWENLPSKTTPITAARLAHMETQYDEAVSYVDSKESSTATVGETALNLSRAFHKKIKFDLQYEHADAYRARQLWGGSLYPQAFAVDEERDELFTVGSNPQIVSVYSWVDGKYKGVVFNLNRTGVTEGAVVKWEGGSRFLYVVGSLGVVDKFDITNPANLSTLTPAQSYPVDAFNRICYRNGVFTTGSTLNDSGGSAHEWRSRGRMSRFDEDFNQIGIVEIPNSMGGGTGDYRTASFPKAQSQAEGPGFFAVGSGGGWTDPSFTGPFYWQGIRLFTTGGEPLMDALVEPGKMLDIIRTQGIPAAIVEQEGLQWVDGGLYSLYPVVSSSHPYAKTGGLLIVEEFSNDPGALDFSSASAAWTMPDVKRIQSGHHPVSPGGILRDLVTWAPLSSLGEIAEYMRKVGQFRFSFYTSSAPGVKDTRGNNLPTGVVCQILNGNDGTFVVTYSRGSVRSFVLWKSGTNWLVGTRTEWVSVPVASGVSALTGGFNRNAVYEGSDGVWLKVAVGPSSGSFFPGGTMEIIPVGGIPEGARPAEPHNLVVPGNTAGPAVRMVIFPNGSVTVNGVPDDTFAYIAGTVHYPY